MLWTSDPIVITGWNVISPIGIGQEEFVENLDNRCFGLKQIGGDGSKFPFSEACIISEFETTKFLGTKGTRFIDRTTGLAVAAAKMALESSGLTTEYEQDRVGVVLGTSTGSLKSIGDFVHEMFAQEKPYFINPACFPNIVLNCAASQCAIRHKLKGINATVSGGQLSLLLALRYASLKIRKGYADTLLTGSVEEFTEQSAWSYYHNKFVRLQHPFPMGEGCAMFVLENREVAQANGRRVCAELLACEVGVYPIHTSEKSEHTQVEGLAVCIRRVLEQANIPATAIDAVSKLRCGLPDVELVQEEGLYRALQGATPRYEFAIGELVGDCFSASGAFQLAALLSLPHMHSLEADLHALVIAAQSDGAVGCALLKIGGN